MKSADFLDQLFGDDFGMQNKLREKIFEQFSQLAEKNGHGSGMEGILNAVKGTEMEGVWRDGLKRQQEINDELVPWLKEKEYKYSNPTTRGVIFVKGLYLTFSIMKHPDHYNLELYHGPIRSVPFHELGYEKSKDFSLVELQKELERLRQWTK